MLPLNAVIIERGIYWNLFDHSSCPEGPRARGVPPDNEAHWISRVVEGFLTALHLKWRSFR
jgi:hypothetical protein